MTLDEQQVAELPQLSRAVGICYLRLACLAEEIDRAGIDVESVNVSVKP